MDVSRASVVMPAYELGETIHDNLREVRRVMGPDVEVIAVDDGSTDATHREMLRAASADPRLVVGRNEVNQGKGAALRAGFRLSSGDPIIFLDGDLDLPAQQVPRILDEFLASGVHVLVGSKNLAMRAGHYPAKRRILSKVFSLVSRILFRLPISETQTGLKIVKRQVLASVFEDVRIVRYAFDLELLMRSKRAGFTIAETPVELRPDASSAPLHFHMLWEMARDTGRIFLWSLRRR